MGLHYNLLRCLVALYCASRLIKGSPAPDHPEPRNFFLRSSSPPLLSKTPGFFSFVTPSNRSASTSPHPRPSNSPKIPTQNVTRYSPTTNRGLCTPRPLSPALWSELKMNEYLDNYPGGKDIDLEKYASLAGAMDFQCGVGRVCDPDQLCEDVYGRDWYALVAAQNWNNFVNILYQAAGDAFDNISNILPTMLIDLEKDPTRTPRHFTAYVGLISNWISSFPSSLFKSYLPIPNSIWMSWGTVSWISLVMASYQISAFGWVETLIIVGNGEDRFKRSSDITWMLGQAQHAVQGAICNITREVISSGISSEQGLRSINRDGVFLSGTPIVDRQVVQKEYERVLKLKTLVKLWRIQNVFIVRGAHRCDQEGKDGAFDDPERISYCDQDSIMMSIVRGQIKGDGFDPTIFRASLVESKYGFSPEFLTTESWQCQQKYGVFEFDPYSYRNATQLTAPQLNDDCIVNLPVCDCTKPAMIEALRNGMSLTQACREINGLPI